jgi:hypothetical protein
MKTPSEKIPRHPRVSPGPVKTFPGDAKSKQFAGGGGQREKGFKQKTAAQVTAAMQGTGMPSTKTNPWIKPARSDASKQFRDPPGRKVF